MRGRSKLAPGDATNREAQHPSSPLPSVSLTMTATRAARVAATPVRVHGAFGRVSFAAQAARDFTRPSGHSFEPFCAWPAVPTLIVYLP